MHSRSKRSALVRARRERPRGDRAAEERDELASFQLIGLHLVPASLGRIAGYRISEDQSAGMPQLICRAIWIVPQFHFKILVVQ
jgi:hypothetical protein